jgi:hypothetical protein
MTVGSEAEVDKIQRWLRPGNFPESQGVPLGRSI